MSIQQKIERMNQIDSEIAAAREMGQQAIARNDRTAWESSLSTINQLRLELVSL